MRTKFFWSLGALATLGMLSGVAVPIFVRARRQSRMTACAGNLSQLWKLETINKVQFGSRRAWPRKTGKSFWSLLSETDPPLVERSEFDVFACPVRDNWSYGQIHYLGPATDLNTLGGNDPVGCDEFQNHSADGSEGGNILRKSGDLQSLRGPEWRRFIESGQCVP